MASEKTRADSLRVYLTGAASNGAAQTNDNASLGNYRASNELQVLGVTISSPISNVTVNYVAGLNGTGSGSLAASASDDLKWTSPGGTQGAAVTILNGETKILEAGDSANKYVRVTRTSAAALSGTATLTLANVVNNAVALDNVLSAEASAGDNEYRCICVKNESSVTVAGVKVYVGNIGTSRVSDSGQLGGSGAGTITTSGSFADWPDSGFCHIKTNAPATREIVYYSSRTNTTLTVPATGRAQGGTSASAGASTDTLESVPGIRLAKESPTGSSTAGNAQTIANEGTTPSGVTWNSGTTSTTGLDIGDMAAGEIYFVWVHRFVPAGAVANPSVLHKINWAFDAA